MKFENIRVMNFENALRGMRNPKDSWDLIDSDFGFSLVNSIDSYYHKVASTWFDYAKEKNKEDYVTEEKYVELYNYLLNNGILHESNDIVEYALIGPRDMKLAKQLIKGGSEHRKFLRQVFVSVDITAPTYWWSEFDTYKIGTTANSTSTMHTIHKYPITIDSFEVSDFNNITYPVEAQRPELKFNIDEDFIQMCYIPYLEYLRTSYIQLEEEHKIKEAKKVWKELIRWTGRGWLQTRTVTMTYENLYNMNRQRKYHKLNEWSGLDDDTLDFFIKMSKQLPYAEDFIFTEEENKLVDDLLF